MDDERNFDGELNNHCPVCKAETGHKQDCGVLLIWEVLDQLTEVK